jgi:DNA polymerase-3 subunit alpha
MSFVPLHLYSGFSYLQSGLVCEKIPVLAKKLGYESVGLCDCGTLSGYAPFTHACGYAGIKPVYGMDAITSEGVFSLFVQSEQGYRNLLKLTLLASEGKLTLPDLKKATAGLTYVLPLESYPFKADLVSHPEMAAPRLAALLQGLPEVYLGIPYFPEDPELLKGLRAFAAAHSYKTVAFPKIIYEKPADAIVLAIVSAIQHHETLEKKEEEGTAYWLSVEEAIKSFTEEERNASEAIAKSAAFSFIEKRGSLLHFANDEGLSSEDYLRKLTLAGLKKRQPTEPPDYLERIDYELSVIDKMGYADYFLIVSDYVNWAKDHGVSVGPGRGSGAGSLVSYCLGIVEADPIRFNLLFERFLNPERQSMPDIDVDFSDINREKVVQHLQDKYGKERVGHVLTTQTIGAKEALRDIARVYGYEPREVDIIIDTIVDDALSLREDYKKSPQFKKLIDSDKYYLSIVSLASKIEGLPRQAGLHAAGIVLNDEPLPDVLPVSDSQGVGYVACLEKDYLEEQGFLKMDLLGLKNLTTIDTCLALIEASEGTKLTYADLPYEDPKAIALIKEGRTMGLFQLESSGMKRAIREVQPSSFEDVAALLALFRPGPMESIPSYARRKNGLEKVAYLSPELEPILKNTYGIIVYQEQIMQIARAMAGFSYGQADLFRRAISKKNAEKLAALKDSFLQGCLANGKDRAVAEKVYALIYKFADYGFNRSHAVSYAVLTCEMAYLKSRFPREFYCAILDGMSPSEAKFKDVLSEIKALGLRMAVPDANRSTRGFRVDGEAIRFPLDAIKSLQSNFLNALLDERKENGPYQDLFDFAARAKHGGLTLPALVRLIDAGALDGLCPSRASLRATAPAAMSYAEMMFGESGQEALLAIGIEKPAMVINSDDPRINLAAEYEALGLMVSGSPLSFYAARLKEMKITPLGEVPDLTGEVETAGIVKSIRAITTKKGSQMAFLELYDEVSELSFILFSEAYTACYSVLKADAIVVVKCHKDNRKEGSYLVDGATSLGE